MRPVADSESTSVAPALRGREASCRVIGPLMEAVEKKGLPCSRLTEGCGIPMSTLENPRERIPWASFLVVLGNLGRVLSDDELIALGRTQIGRNVHRTLFLPGRLLFSLRDIYFWGSGPDGPVAQTLAAQTMECTELAPNRLRHTVRIKPGYGCTREFWLLRQGLLESVPRAFGLPLAKVTLAKESETSGYFDIELPPDESLFNRVRERATWIFAARDAARELRRVNEDLHRRNLELQAEMEGRQRAEDELRRLNAELEKRVLERTQELELFSYSVAHDLRAPLRAVNGFATAVMEDHGHVLDEDAKRQLSRVIDNALRMGALIDALLALWRVTRAELRREQIDLADVATTIIEELRRIEPKRAVDLKVDGPFLVHGDPNLLRSLLQNLLENAWKFTRDRSPARIELSREGEIFRIRDNGLGFDMQYAKTLFAPFHRLRPKEFEGTGIGLAIADRICRRHGGKIWVDASPDEGATFSFTLAAGAPETSDKNKTTSERPNRGIF